MSSQSLIVVRDDSCMNDSSPGPRSGGPARRRLITPVQKLDHLGAYEVAVQSGGGGAYLREQGIYSSQITEWRKLRDAGVLSDKKSGQRIGRLSPEQTEIARLRRALQISQRRLGITEVALEIMGKAHELLEQISKGSHDDDTPPMKR